MQKTLLILIFQKFYRKNKYVIQKRCFCRKITQSQKDTQIKSKGAREKSMASAIGHFESGRRKPSFDNLVSLTKSLKVSADYLLGISEDINGNTSTFKNVNKLSSVEIASIQAFINVLARKK